MNTNVTSALTFYLMRPSYESFSLLCTSTINNAENTSVSSNLLKCQLTILHSALDILFKHSARLEAPPNVAWQYN